MKKGYTHVTFVLDNSGSMDHLRMDTIGGYNSFKRKQNEDPGSMTFSLYQFDKSRGYAGWHNPVYVAPAAPYTPAPGPLYPGVANNIGPFISTAGGTAAVPAVTTTVTTAVAITTGEEGGLLIGGAGAIGSAHANADPSILMMNGVVPQNVPSIEDVQVVSTFEFVDFKTVPDLNKDTYVCNTNTPLLDAIGYAIDRTGLLLAALPEDHRPEKVIFVILTDGAENASQRYSHAEVMAKRKHQEEVYKWDFLFLGANQDAIQVGASFGIGRGRSMTYAATAQSMGSTYNAVSDTLTLMKSAVNSKDVNFDENIRAAVFDGTYAGAKTAVDTTLIKGQGVDANGTYSSGPVKVTT